MHADKPIPDRFDSHIQISPNFTRTPGLTPLTADNYMNRSLHNGSKVQRVYAAIHEICHSNNFSIGPHTGFHYAGSYEWTELPDRDKVRVCVVELEEKDIDAWKIIDKPIRAMLDELGMGPDGVFEVPLRYYICWRGDTSHNGDGKMEVFPEGPVNWTPEKAFTFAGDAHVLGMAQRSEVFEGQAARTRAARRAVWGDAPRPTLLAAELEQSAEEAAQRRGAPTLRVPTFHVPMLLGVEDERIEQELEEGRRAVRDRARERVGRVDSNQQVPPTASARPPTRRRSSEANVNRRDAAESSSPSTPPTRIGRLSIGGEESQSPPSSPPQPLARNPGIGRRSGLHSNGRPPQLHRTQTIRSPPALTPTYPTPSPPMSQEHTPYALSNAHSDPNLLQHGVPSLPDLVNFPHIPQPSHPEDVVAMQHNRQRHTEILHEIQMAGAQIPDFNPEPEDRPRMGLRELAEAAHARRGRGNGGEVLPEGFRIVAEMQHPNVVAHPEWMRMLHGDEAGRGFQTVATPPSDAALPPLPPGFRPIATYPAHPESMTMQYEHEARVPSTPSSRPDQTFALRERFRPLDGANVQASRDAAVTGSSAADVPRTLPSLDPGLQVRMYVNPDPSWPSIDPAREQDLSLDGDDYSSDLSIVDQLRVRDSRNYEHARGHLERAGAVDEDVLQRMQPGNDAADPAVARLYRSVEQMDVRNRSRRGVLGLRDEWEDKDESEVDEREIDLDAERRWEDSLEVIRGVDPYGADLDVD